MYWLSLNVIKVCVFFLILVFRLVGIEDLFDVVLGNEDYKEYKLKLDVFIIVVSWFGVKFEDCWGFEDM